MLANQRIDVTMGSLAILGAGGHGRVVADAALASGWAAVAFFDDGWPAAAGSPLGSVKGTSADLCRVAADYTAAIVAIGNNAARLAKIGALRAAGLPVVSVVHPAAVVSPFATIGPGSAVFAGAIINPCASVGEGCIINTAASVDHDCVLEDGVHVGPGARLGGGVRLGRASWIGIGASVRHGIAVGAGATVGAGAAAVSDVPAGVVVLGVPAKAR